MMLAGAASGIGRASALAMAAEAIERRRETILSRVPLGRIGSPEEIAEAVVWLCSDHARYITGEGLGVDGGYIAA